MRTRLQIVLLIVLALAGAAAAVMAWRSADKQLAERSAERGGLAASLGKPMGIGFELVDQDGRSVRSADFDGKVRLVFFGFTHCPDVCPTGLSLMSQLLEDLGDGAKDVRALFITVDPERDTPQVMKAYVSNFANGIVGLTGTSERVAAAVRSFYAYFKKVPQSDGSYTVDHTASVYLLDRDGNFRATIDLHENLNAATAKLRRLVGVPE